MPIEPLATITWGGDNAVGHELVLELWNARDAAGLNLDLQPGDQTRYRFSVIPDFIGGRTVTNHATCFAAYSHRLPYVEMNEHTRCLMLEVVYWWDRCKIDPDWMHEWLNGDLELDWRYYNLDKGVLVNEEATA